MVVQNLRKFKPVENLALLDAMHREMSMEYQNRITPPSQAGVEGTLKQLANYRPANNEFISALFNKIGLQIFQYNNWTNPFAEFKRGMLTHGDTIEEVQTGLIEAKAYNVDREVLEGDLFGTSRPEVQTSYHKINREDSYKVTINEPILQRAFLQENGISNFISGLMAAPTISDNWDEFLLTCSLFPLYESNGGFFKIQVPDVSNPNSTADDAKDALRKLRAMADNLAFLSTKYNAAHMPISAQADELLLFVTPEFKAAIDVEALAAAFNLSHTQMHGRIIPIPAEHFGIDGVQAIMTTREFFVMADTVMTTTSLENPGNLQHNHWLHHHQIISASRFVPAIMFTTHRGTDDVIVIDAPASISAVTVTDRDENPVEDATVTRADLYQLHADVTYDSGKIRDAVRWELFGNTDYRTRITTSGVLHIAGTEGASQLTVRAVSTFKDAADLMADGLTAELVLTVDGEFIMNWPVENATVPPNVDDADVPPTVEGITVAGVAVPAFSPSTLTYTVVAPDWTGDGKAVQVQGVDNGNVKVAVNAAKTVAKVSVPGAPGDPVYTVNVSTS